MPRSLRALVLLLLCLVAGAGAIWGFSRPEPALEVAGSPFAVSGPIRAYWEANGGLEKLGPPRSDALWFDGWLTQFFDDVALRADERGHVESIAQPAGWRAGLPPEVLALPAFTERALVSTGAVTQTQPLADLLVNVRLESWASGNPEVRVYDAHNRLVGSWLGYIRNGAGVAMLQPGGAPGPQRLVVLVEGRIAAVQSDAYRLEATTAVETGLPRYDALFALTRGFLARNTLTYELDGQSVHGYRSPDSRLLWLRDHAYQARAGRLFDPDATSLLEAFRRAQLPDGSFPDYLAWPEHEIPARRMPVEADVEYLFVQAVYEAWQAGGDDAWLRGMLPAMRRALRYTLGDPQRWDAEQGLVKRPYTLDTWDFEYGPTTADPRDGRPAPRHWIDAQTRWSIFHGDNTGLARALRLMARAEERVGEGAEAGEAWREQARAIMRRLNDLSWNGRFFTHMVPLEPFEPPGVDAAEQLSLSNALALNRGVLERTQARAIVEEYYRRYQERGAAFAEWYGIDPPFPARSYGLGGRTGERPGEYVNGGIMPLVGGELARGAFGVGSERYGLDILARYTSLITATNSSYLWYYPAGNPGISGLDTVPHDGWGAGAMLAALIEGAGGVADNGARFDDATLSPRWAADADARDVRVVARYAASGGYVAYRWQLGEGSIRVRCTGSGEAIRLRILAPPKMKPSAVLVNGQPTALEVDDINGSRYAVVDVPGAGASVEVRW
jgi:hypothetical protein